MNGTLPSRLNLFLSRLSYVRRLTILTITTLTFILAGCSTQNSPTGGPAGTLPSKPPSDKVKVVTTTTILADFARNVGGELVDVVSLVPSGSNVHSFQTSPSDSLMLGKADMIVSNGAGLDNFLDPVLLSAQQPGSIRVLASQGLKPAEIEELEFQKVTDAEHVDEEEQGHDESGADPHFWLDPVLAARYIESIRQGLTQVDPANAQQYAANAEVYTRELEALDREIAESLAQVPPQRRHLVTFHDAYGYFARRYDWQVSAFVPSDASDVTPTDIVLIMERIKMDGIPAVFAEPQFNYDVLLQASQDAGVSVGIIRSLVDSQASTYLEMMRSNTDSLVEHLK